MILPGLLLDQFTMPLSDTLHVDNPSERLYARCKEEVDDNRPKTMSVQEWWDAGRWTYMSYDALASTFTQNELVCLFWLATTTNPISDRWHATITRIRDDHHEYEHVLWKIHHSMWMWGMKQDYATFVKFYRGLRNLSFGPDFEVRLDHTYSYNERGTCVHTRLASEKPAWLDGVFGLIVYFKGEHVMTVGFSATSRGVLIHQVQLRKKKGNRFLFKLPVQYLEYTVDRFMDAFGDLDILLIDGCAAVEQIRKSYGSAVPQFDAKNVSDRIQTFYDQSLIKYDRLDISSGTMVPCHRLIRA